MTLMNQTTEIDIYDGKTDTVLATIMCDMQPYSGGLAQKEYGLEIDRAMRIYTEPCDALTEGERIALSGETPMYIVKYAEHWDDYSMAVLTELPLAAKEPEDDPDDVYGGGFY